VSTVTAERPSVSRDPRLRERRVAVARAAGRRRLRLVLAAAGLAAVIGGGLALLHSPLLAARVVRISGASHTPRPAVLAASGLSGRPPLIDVGPAAVAARLEALPWVATASVRRQWPDGVRVALTERTPVAVVVAGGETALVDASGRVLARSVQQPSGTFRILAPAPLPAPGADLPPSDRPLLAVANGFPASLAPAVRAIEERAGGVDLVLAAGPLVELGPQPRPGAQAVALATLLARVGLAGVVAIDLRVPTAPVLTR